LRNLLKLLNVIRRPKRYLTEPKRTEPSSEGHFPTIVKTARPDAARPERVRDNYNPKSHKYVCITTYQPDTTYNPNPNPNHDPTTKQQAIVNIQLNIVACLTYPDEFIRDMLLHRLFDFRSSL